MEPNNFILGLIGGLEKIKSIKQIKADLKTFGDVYMKLVASFDEIGGYGNDQMDKKLWRWFCNKKCSRQCKQGCRG